MATRKPRLTQAQKRARSDLSKLKKLGLFKGRVDRPTRYGVETARKFRDVVKGTAAVVTVPKDAAKDYAGQYRVRNNKVVVPRAKGTRVRFSKRSQEITTRRKVGKDTVRGRKPRGINSPADLPRGPNIRYVIPLAGGTILIRETSFDRLVKMMTEYENNKKNPYHNWWRYIEIESIDEDADDE